MRRAAVRKRRHGDRHSHRWYGADRRFDGASASKISCMGATPSRTRRAAIPGPRANDAVLQPLDGESLASWVSAMAKHRAVEPAALARELHLHRDGALSMAQMRLSEQVVRRLHRKTGVDEAALHQMTLARYAGNALPHLPLAPWAYASAVQQWRSSAWLSPHRARWCAPCLREGDFRWPLSWMLPWTFVCLQHRVFMATECMRCLSPVRYDRYSTLARSCDARVDERWERYGYDERCEFPIGLHRPLPVTDDSLLLHQERINACSTGIRRSPTGSSLPSRR